MPMYTTSNLASRDNPKFRRNRRLEAQLREIGLTFSTTLDWGMDVNYVHVEAKDKTEAEIKIRENASLLRRAYDVCIGRNLYIGKLATS